MNGHSIWLICLTNKVDYVFVVLVATALVCSNYGQINRI